jgi:broad specificity phosphatase PhoE
VTELVLVRHGETQANLAGVYCGRLDPPLAASGFAAAEETAARLGALTPGRVLCSAALRARQTAAIVAPGAAAVVLPSLREMDFGAFEGLAADDISQRMPQAWQAYMADYRRFTFPGGDNVNDYLTKAAETINAIVREPDDGSVLIVSHKGFILSALSALLHGDSDHIFCYDIRPAGYARLAFVGGAPVLKQLV